jgi:hypothetical protein
VTPLSDPLAFSLAWLAEAAEKKPQLGVCAAGHLVVRDVTCWAPKWFSADGRALYCEPVYHPDRAQA